MKSGFKILWTDNALKELQTTLEYLEENWSDKEIRNLVVNLEKTLYLISSNPYIFQASDFKKELRRAIVLTLNSLYFKVNQDTIEIISFFSNRQNPKNRKLK